MNKSWDFYEKVHDVLMRKYDYPDAEAAQFIIDNSKRIDTFDDPHEAAQELVTNVGTDANGSPERKYP